MKKYKYIVLGVPVLLFNAVPVVLAVKLSWWWLLALPATITATIIVGLLKGLMDQTMGNIVK